MNELLPNLAFALAVTGPIMLVLALGVVLARWGVLTDAFIDAGTKLVFNVTLPALLFITVSQTRFEQTANIPLIVIGLVGTLAVFLIMEVVAGLGVTPPQDRGVIVQGAYRSNMGIVGLAYCVNAYGEVGLAAASLYLGMLTILYNILAVITLNRSLSRHRSIVPVLTAIFRNPLIIGIVAALPLAYFEVPLPELLLQTGEYFAQMTLPLALLCTGASLSLVALHGSARNALIGTSGKVFLSPLVLTGAAFLSGFRGMELGIVFMMSVAPTASASYIMSRAMGGNAALSANIIVLSTIGSVLVTSLGITWLRFAGII